MNQEKVGQFIKDLRKQNKLTQKDLADKYGVTYQAVSKWENGINLPEISLLRQMSKDFNISLEDILDGEIKQEKTNLKKLIIPIILGMIILIVVLIVILNKKNESFEFKTISTTCEEFKVTGSLAYNKDKSYIYISNINYCGGNDDTEYEEIECALYETHNDTSKKLTDCKLKETNIKLEEYLKDIELNIENYSKMCKTYTDESLYLEINAKNNNKITTYKIPLNINNTCGN